MTERISEQQSKDIAEIALAMTTGTSGEVLAALNRAWRAGYSEGFGIGLMKGQKHMADVIDMVQGTMP